MSPSPMGKETDDQVYSQTSLIRASLIRMPHNPNTLRGNFLLFSIYNDLVIHMFYNPNTF